MPDILALCSPDDIEKMYKVTSANPVRDGFQSLKKVRDETKDNYFEQKSGLLPENHDEWWRVRSRVQTPMMKQRNLFQYLPQMDQISREFLDRIAQLQKENGEMPSSFLQEIYKWSLESVGLVALNRRFGCLDPNIKADSSQLQLIKTVNDIFKYLNITEMALQLWKYFPTPSYKKLKAGHDVFFRIADTHIREAESEVMARNSKPGAGDHESTLLEVLLKKEGLNRSDVVTIILDMLFAGIDTTAHTIAFTLYLLARNPSAQKRVQEEVDSVLGAGKEAITDKHLQRLSFLKCCIKESLRYVKIPPMFHIILGMNMKYLKKHLFKYN
ncbi:UNVERIFIED_CONTAM: hypothetical protein GTU68_048614 [Idotea baltica]|nr:hypothetical protein [Idotea baltica]